MVSQEAEYRQSSGRQPRGEEGNHKARRSRRRHKRLIRICVLLAVVVAAVLLPISIWQKKTYHDYRVLATSGQEDTVSTKYKELGGNILRYSGSGASLVNKKQETLWNITYDEMQNPNVDECDNTVVIYDQGGTTMSVFNKDGQLGSVTTSLNIVKARVVKQGVVAAIIEGGEDTWINFYATDGSLIAENQIRIDDPGYPLDISVSKDGLMLMVTYQYVDGGKTTSYVAFYNFGAVGQNQIDNIVSGYKYEGVVIPKVAYLDGDTAVAFRDDGFTLYNGKEVPKEGTTVAIKQEIVSAFYDEDMIGLVLKNDSTSSKENKSNKEKQYVMRVYNKSGRLKFTTEFGIAYTDIKASDGQIVMHNSSQVCVISPKGVEKFNGVIDEGSISDFFKLGMNQYVLVLDNGLSLIKFK